MSHSRSFSILIIVALLVAPSSEGKHKVLYADKNAKIPVRRVALLYVHYPTDVVATINGDDNGRAKNLFADFESQVRGNVTKRIRELGYETTDLTGGDWDASRASYADRSNAGLMGPPVPAMLAFDGLTKGAGAEWLKSSKLSGGTAFLSFGVFRHDLAIGEDLLDSNKAHYEVYLTVAAQLNVFPEGKKPIAIWKNLETRQWTTVANRLAPRDIDPKEARTAILDSISKTFLDMPPIKQGTQLLAVSTPGTKAGEPKASTPELLDLLRDPAPNLRRRATDSIGALGSSADPKLVSRLLKMLIEEREQDVIVGVIRALAETGNQQREAVIAALQSASLRCDISCGKCFGDAFTRLQATEAHKQYLSDLLHSSESSDQTVRRCAFGKLVEVAPDLPESAILEISARLRSKNAPTELWGILKKAAPAHPELITRELIKLAVLGRGGLGSVSLASSDLVEIAKAAGPGAIPPIAGARSELVRAIREGERPTPSLAARFLALLGADALDDLFPLTADGRIETREAASAAIADVGQTAIPILVHALSSSEDVRRASAINALARIRPRAPVVGAVATALADDRARLRDAAAHVLGLIGSEARAAEPRLLVALNIEKETVVLRSVIWALGKIGSVAAVPGMLNQLRAGSNASIRSAAAEALGAIRPVATRTISALVDATADKAVNSSASSALRSVGLAALPELARAISHPNSDARLSAQIDLGMICEHSLWANLSRDYDKHLFEVVEAFDIISRVVVPKLAECGDPACANTATSIRNGVALFGRDILREIEDPDWSVTYDRLSESQALALDTIVIAVAKSLDSIPERFYISTLSEHRAVSEEVAAAAAAIREDLAELALVLIAKYPGADMARKLTNERISYATLKVLGLR